MQFSAPTRVTCDVDTVLLKRLYVLVFIHHDTRFVRIAGITANPVADWVTQQARNISMDLADQATTIKFSGPRPRHQVHRLLLRGGHQDHQEPRSLASGQRDL
jgi:hypothetical protein